MSVAPNWETLESAKRVVLQQHESLTLFLFPEALLSYLDLNRRHSVLKMISLTLLVAGMSTVLSACEKKDSTAQSAYDKKGSTAQVPSAGSRPAKAKELALDLGDKVTLKLIQIPAGTFLMGSHADMRDRDDDEGLPIGKWVNGNAQMEITISKPFYLGVYEVTVDQYAQFLNATGTMHKEPDFKQTGDHPVVNVSWDDARNFCQWLSKKTGKQVGLPTEAQWEYACRAGSKTRFSFGDRGADIGDYAWIYRNSKHMGVRMTHPVGQKKPNAWGLYDMHGNASEWCADFYGGYALAGADPTGPEHGTQRVVRGGAWTSDAWLSRSARRERIGPDARLDDLGFRVAVLAADRPE